jgi:hypothetical protein
VTKLAADGVLVAFWSSAVFDPNTWNLPVHAVKSDPDCDALAPDEVLTTSIASSEAQFREFVASIPK